MRGTSPRLSLWSGIVFHVKPREDSVAAFAAMICQQADSVGVEVQEEACAQLLRHLQQVLRANQSFNLTSITDAFTAVRLHIVDSLVGAPDVMSAPPGRLADIGSGAGYPGIPLAIVTRRHTTLFESNGKKSAFLRDVVLDLGLGSRIEVAGKRSEELSEDQRDRCGVVTARALSSIPSLLELASPLLQVGGLLIAYKGVVSNEERSRGEEAARVLGFESRGERRIFLPVGGEERTIVKYVKCDAPDVSLPRRPGLAQRRPLV